MPPKGRKGRGRGRGRGRGGQGHNPRPGEASGQRVDLQARSPTQLPQERQPTEPQQHQGQRKQQQQQREEPLEERAPVTSSERPTAEASAIPHPSQSESISTQQSESKQEPAAVEGATALDETTKKLSQLTTSSSIGFTKREEEIRYPNRPNYGTVGRAIQLRSNFFPLTLPRNDFIYHYDVAIEPEAVKPVHREIMKLLYEKYGKEAFGKAEPAYDGSKNLYTLKDLPLGKDGAKLNVVLPSPDGKKNRTFTVKIKFAAKVYLKDLKDFLERKGAGTRPQDSIMTIDILLRHIPSFQFEAIGRGAFFPQNTKGIPIGDGVELRFGFSQSVRHSEWNTVLVNVDVCAKAFYKRQPLLGYVCEVLNIGDQELQNPGFFSNKRVQQQLKDAIWGLRVETTHCATMKRKFVIGGTTQKAANQETFEFEGKQVTIHQYMREKYNVNLRYPNLPCIKKQGGNAMFPFETLEVVPCVKRKITDDQTAKMIRETARPAFEREKNISDWAKQLESMNRNYLNKEFGMEMKSQMVNVGGRVLPTPVLALGGRENQLTPRDGAWDMRGKQFYNGVSIECWAIVLFVPEQRCRADAVRRFASMFQDTSRKEGVRIMSDPIDVKYEHPQRVEAVLCALTAKHRNLEFIFCVLPDTKKALYGEIKRVGDNVIGLVTQCIQQKFVYQPKPQVCSNIAMKVNAKLGGINHVIHKDVQAPIFKEPVIIFGADVTHPMPGDTVSPSIAAVVASVDLQASQYTSVVRAQASKKNKPSKKSETAEIIENLDGIVKELLIRYRNNTKAAPSKILFYRDGVSEGQFEQVYLYELRAIQKACLSLSPNYKPGITLVIVQKRHHTRLFCANRQDQVGKAGNVPPGTTVDKGIVHPYEFDFYLCSHFGIQGTSRPAHYHVLHDDNKFTADHLQQVTNQLCYTFARCTRAISIPAPAYYAHLVAFRARYHMHSDKYSNGRQPKSQDEVLRIVNNDIKIEEKHGKTMYFT